MSEFGSVPAPPADPLLESLKRRVAIHSISTGHGADRDRFLLEAAVDRIEMLIDTMDALTTAVEWEVPPIRDGVDVERRCAILAEHARGARGVLAQGTEAGTGETDFCAESAQKSGSTATPRKPGP